MTQSARAALTRHRKLSGGRVRKVARAIVIGLSITTTK
jgi:hypothetical protein